MVKQAPISSDYQPYKNRLAQLR